MPITEDAFPGAIISDPTDGGVEWNEPSKAGSNNDEFADVVLPFGDPDSQRLQASNFIWPTMQSADELLELYIGIRRKASHADSIHDLQLRMIVEGSVDGADMHNESDFYSTDEFEALYDVLALSGIEGLICAKLLNAATGFFYRVQNASIAGTRTAFADLLFFRATFEQAAPRRRHRRTLRGVGR